MKPEDAVRRLREAAEAVAALPTDDDRLPGFARDMAAAWAALDAAMIAGSMPLQWSMAAEGEHR